MSTDYSITTRCYLKVLMHSLKYPHATVNGVLLAEKTSGKKSGSNISGGGNSGAKDGGGEGGGNQPQQPRVVEFVDVVPLFHLGHGLTPMIEVALLQISAQCKERNLVIAGYYQANKYFHDSYPDVFAQRIAEKICEQNNDAVLLMVHNYGLAKFTQDEDEADQVLLLHTFSDGKWKQQQKQGSLSLGDPKKAFDCLNELVYSKQRHFDLNDFDNHLDDISVDWSNKALNELIDDCLKTI